jgi:hypothetical protein
METIRRSVGGRRPLVVGVVLFALVVASLPVEAATPPGGVVSQAPITAEELLSGALPTGLTRNDRFLPSRDARPARRPFVGTLRLDGATMEVLSDAPGGEISNPVLGKDTTFFPDVALEFFTVDGRLVPTTQDVIRNGALSGTRSYWDIIVQPGRVWKEPADGAWNRASFPFALVNSIEGETHTGVALFLYRGHRVSPVRFQIVQMSSPFYVPEYFTAWGTSGAQWKQGGVDRLGERKRGFRAEQAQRLPVRPWSDLARHVPTSTLDAFTSYADVFQSAVVRQGVIYRTDCPTAAGPFPYCDDVRFGVWSVTKSAMLNVALLRLAQKYGDAFLDEPIADYVPAAAVADGWDDVTFEDLANMASGHGPEGDPTCYLCDYDRWYVALSEQEKTAEALDYPGPFAPPGTVFNYRDQDAYLLGVALDGVVKAHQPRATVWDLLRKEVYRPLGIFHAPTNSTFEPDGSPGQPLMAYGYYATLDDLAKIALLFQQGGRWKGDQILDASLVAKYAPEAEPPAGALPASDDGNTYYFTDWWFNRLESDEGCARYLAAMEGWGGITVTLAPAGIVVLRMRNLWVETPDPRASIDALVDALATVCD